MEWILIIAMYAGVWADTDSIAITNVRGFISQQECTIAGNASKSLASGTKKDVSFVCVQQTARRTT